MSVKAPWYKRWWFAFAMLLAGVLGGIAFVTRNVISSKMRVKGLQKQDEQHVKDRLTDKHAVEDAKLDQIDSKLDANKSKAESDRKESLHEIDEKAKADAAKNSASPDDASRALGSALERAAHKLNNSGGGVH